LGKLTAEASAELGLPADCRVIAGCLDQYAGALGLGNNHPGLISETTGTVLATVACSSNWESNRSPQIFRGPGANEHTFFHMSFGDISANLLEHYRQQLPDRPSFEALSESVSRTDRLELEPEARLDELKAVISRWARTQSRGDIVRAIFRVVAKALAAQVERVAGDQVDNVRSAGGAARSREWLQIKADVLGVPFVAPVASEPAILGAASLAAKALNWQPLNAIDAPLDSSRIVHPQKIPC
jgi:xylulokinase